MTSKTLRFRSASRNLRPTPARGVSILLVMALLTMTLALSYAMVRLNFTVERTHSNYQRLGDSRQAAYTGISAALRKMQQSSWSGVGVNLTGDLGGGMSYAVTFVSGDASLTTGSSNYNELPYRVTLVSTGTAADPANLSVSSTHRVQAIVRLIPRKLYDPPANWNTLQNYTLYQWGTGSGDTLSLDLPVRVEGPIFAQNAVAIAPSYPSDNAGLPFAGQIDEVAVLGKALSDAQILSLYQGSSTVSGLVAGGGYNPILWLRLDEPSQSIVAQDQFNQYDGVFDGGKPGAGPAPVNGGTGSASFDGINDHIHLGAIDVLGSDLTILAWIKPSSFASDFGRIIAKANGTDTDDHYWAISNYRTGSGGRGLRFRLKTNSGGTETLDASGVSLVAGQWSFIAAVYDGSKMKVYQNGVKKNQTDKNGAITQNSSVFVSVGNIPSSSPRAKYLRDITRRWAIDGTDHRPLTGAITAPFSKTSSDERSLVTDELQTTWNDTAVSGAAPLSLPGVVTTYRLYPGGISYNIPTLGSLLRDQTLGPDPAANPLGVFYRLGNLDVRNNVSVTGVVIVNATGSNPDMEISGTNVHFNSVALPQLDGSAVMTKLPVAIVKDDLRVYDGAGGDINGLAVAWGELGFQSGSQNNDFTITGRVIANEFYSQPRSEWDSNYWYDRLRNFFLDLDDSNPILFFPQWLQANRGLNPAPRLIVRPPQASETFHWHDWSQPIFVAHPSDGGLRWEVLELRELP